MTAQEFKKYKELFKEMKKTVENWEIYFDDMDVLVGDRTMKAYDYMMFLNQFNTFENIPPYMAAQDSAITHSLSKIVKAIEEKVKENRVEVEVEVKEENKFDINADLRTEHTFRDDDRDFFTKMYHALNNASTLKNSKEYDDLLKALKKMDENIMLIDPDDYDEERYKNYLNKLEEAADNYLTHKVNKGTKENSVKKVNVAFALKEYIAQRRNTFGQEGKDVEGVEIAEEPKAQEKARAYMALSNYALNVKSTEVTVAEESKQYATRAENNLAKLGKKEDLDEKLDEFAKRPGQQMKDFMGYKYVVINWKTTINKMEEEFKSGADVKIDFAKKLATYFAKQMQLEKIGKYANVTYSDKKYDDIRRTFITGDNVEKLGDFIMKSDAFAEIVKSVEPGNMEVKGLYDKFRAQIKEASEKNNINKPENEVGKKVVNRTVNQNLTI